jgi:hypothetical protein
LTIAAWGRNMATSSLGSNSRVRGKAALDLGGRRSGDQSSPGLPSSLVNPADGSARRRTGSRKITAM